LAYLRNYQTSRPAAEVALKLLASPVLELRLNKASTSGRGRLTSVCNIGSSEA